MSTSIIAHETSEEKNEDWKPVTGLEGRYSVSSLGRVRSEKFSKGSGRAGGGRVLKPWINKGYAYVKVSKEGGRQYGLAIHRAVAAAFLGTCPEGCVINHKNLDKTDNRTENLEYVSQAENTRHAREAGHYSPPPALCGTLHWSARMTEEDVNIIRASFSSGVSIAELRKTYCVSDGCIRGIVTHRTWRHLK